MPEHDDLRWEPEDTPHLSREELAALLAEVVDRGRRERAQRRSAALASAAVAVAVVLAVALLAAQQPEQETVRVAGDPRPPITGVTTTAPPTTVAPTTVPEVPRPARAVVTRPGDEPERTMELVLVDGRTGRDVRTLYRTSFDIQNPELSPDGKHVYFVEESCGPSPVVRLAVDGPEGRRPEPVSERTARDIALSADGRLLAYIAAEGCDDSNGQEPMFSVRVRDLAQGSERVVTEASPQEALLDELTWSPDGTRLAVQVSKFEDARQADGYIAVLDAATRQDVARALRLTSPRRGFVFASPTYLPDGTLFVVERPTGTRVGKEPSMLLVVDAGSGRTLRTVATGDPARFYLGTDTDASGKHLLYISLPPGNEPGELRVSSHEARTVVLLRGVWRADW